MRSRHTCGQTLLRADICINIITPPPPMPPFTLHYPRENFRRHSLFGDSRGRAKTDATLRPWSSPKYTTVYNTRVLWPTYPNRPDHRSLFAPLQRVSSFSRKGGKCSHHRNSRSDWGLMTSSRVSVAVAYGCWSQHCNVHHSPWRHSINETKRSRWE